MSSIAQTIEYNMKSDFEVLSDYVFVKQEMCYLASPFGSPLGKFKFKHLRTDQDGVCEKEDTIQLSILHFEEIADQNPELKLNLKHLTEDIFYKPVETQEIEIAELLRGCNVNLEQFFYGGQRAVRRFESVRNLHNYVNTTQRKLSYTLEVHSGVFKEAKVVNGGLPENKYPGPLRLLWEERLGLPPENIRGSVAYFNEDGVPVKIMLELEHRKSEPAPEYLQYIIGCTDYLKSDFPMIDVNINTIPIALVFGELQEIPRGVAIACPRARKDMMEVVELILKIERGFIEKVGGIDTYKAEKIGREVEKLFEMCSRDNSSFLEYRRAYVDKSFEFLDALTILVEEKYPLFPEKKTGIRKYLSMLKNTSDIVRGKELLEKTINIMKKYSAEFPK